MTRMVFRMEILISRPCVLISEGGLSSRRGGGTIFFPTFKQGAVRLLSKKTTKNKTPKKLDAVIC